MYCSLDDLKKLQSESTLLQLADDDNAGAFVVSPANTAYSNVLSAIAEADTIINSYLSGRYTVPITSTVPDVVAKISAQLALCALYDRRRELDVPEGIQFRRKMYLELLKDIKAEKASIPELSISAPSIVTVNKTADDQLFSDDLLSAF